jgi:hypothetical protein
MRLLVPLPHRRLSPGPAETRTGSPLPDIDAGYVVLGLGKRPGGRHTAAAAQVENRSGGGQTSPQIGQPRRIMTLGCVVTAVAIREGVIPPPDYIALRICRHSGSLRVRPRQVHRYSHQRRELTATMTATAAANGSHERPAASGYAAAIGLTCMPATPNPKNGRRRRRR